MQMSERKTEVVNLRMSRQVKDLLRIAAAHERRTLSNMLEVLIIDFCREHNLTKPATPYERRDDVFHKPQLADHVTGKRPNYKEHDE